MIHHTVTLQLATQGDAHDIARMSATLIEQGLPRAWTESRVSKHIKHKDSIVLVAKASHRLMGFAIMQFGDDTAHLNLLAVTPHARRNGIAKQLLTWLHETAMVAGTFIIHLELRAENFAARRFYLSMGYQESGYARGYYSNIEDAVRMSCDLTVKS